MASILPETGKDRWRRIPKDYFRKPDPIHRAKLLLSGVALVLSVGWWMIGLDWKNPKDLRSTDGNSLLANHGDLNKVHAAWDQKCDACHVPFEPINGRPLLSWTSTQASRTSDKLCMTCHSGPAHHATVKEADVKSCAECHIDHRGREASLVRLNDRECTQCHSSLADHTNQEVKAKGSRVYAGKIDAFWTNHPDFKSEFADHSKTAPVDRSKLKFNHKLHMSQGIVKNSGDILRLVSSIEVASERARYGSDPNQPIQLDCSSCHVLDSGNASVAIKPTGPVIAPRSRSSGDYYLPVNFQNSCRACHPLTVVAGSSTLEAPHGVSPGEVVDFLRQTFAAQVLKEKPEMLQTFVPKTPIPGKRLADESAGKLRDQGVANAEALLFGSARNNCNECHYTEGVDHGVVPKSIVPTKVPDVWFTHAFFDHTSHRAVSCRECHARSYAVEADGKTLVKDASTSHLDVLLPAKDNCIQCHAPSQGGWAAFSAKSNATGGVSASCVECHKYHGGDHPLQGRGAFAQEGLTDKAGRAGRAELSILEFLAGPGAPKLDVSKRKPTSP